MGGISESEAVVKKSAIKKGNKIKGTRQVLVIKYPRRRPVHLEKRLEKTRIAKNKA
jgi:hypothetical protein